MATEPITIFSRKIDPAGVARLLRNLSAKVEIQGSDENWSKAVISTGSLWNKRQLVFSHDPNYYSQPNWTVQLNGMQGYFSRFPAGESRERVLALIPTFKFALGTIHNPDFKDNDDRLEIISSVAQFLDAVLFLPSSLRDSRGRILLSAGGKTDTQAIWPQLSA